VLRATPTTLPHKSGIGGYGGGRLQMASDHVGITDPSEANPRGFRAGGVPDQSRLAAGVRTQDGLRG
jgi:hypothetical protein